MLTYLLSFLVSLVIVMISSPFFIPMLHRLKFGQIEREEGPASHKVKQGTPTMGGIIFIVATLISALAFGFKNVNYLLPAILAMFGFGLIGFLDDFIKITMTRNLGLKAYQKFSAQFLLAFVFAYWAYMMPTIGSTLYLPISGKTVDFGFWYIPFVMFVILSEVNAVNLIDGLDGLASSVTIVYIIAMIFVVLILARQAEIARELSYATDLRGLALFAFATVGSLIGFLWFNTYPAKIFMGDTGSLALGGVVSILAICTRSVLLLPLMGVCFLATALSVVLQVGSYKLRHGKRIFRMAPLHHHFELGGVHETKIVASYTIISIICCAIALISYMVPRT